MKFDFWKAIGVVSGGPGTIQANSKKRKEEQYMTKIANPDIISTAKQELIDRIKQAIDIQGVRRILEFQHNMEIGENIEVSGGDVMVYNNQLVYRMDFEVLFSLSVLFDNEGNYIPSEDTPDENIEELGREAEDIIQKM